QITVIQDIAAPNANAGPDKALNCITTQVSLSGSSSTQGVTFSWTASNGGNTATPVVDAAGTYTLTVTNPANGCTASDVAEVSENRNIPDISVSCHGVLNCIITSAQLFATSSTEGVTFSWTGPGGFTSTEQNPVVSTAGIFTVTVTAPNGCMNSAQITVVQDVTTPVCSLPFPENVICGSSGNTLTATTSHAD